ncbi:MAG: type II secretion system protein N [Betaproteobacteria bacterium]
MGRILALVVAVLLLVAAALLWLAPATLVAPRLERATDGGVSFADADGSVWKGRASLVAGGIRVPMAWSIDPLPLAKGELHVRVTPHDGAATGAPRADVTWRDGRAVVRDVDVVLPAAWMVAAAGIRVPWRPTGDLAVTVATLEWAPPASRGEARIVWRDARIAFPAGGAPVDLGTVSATAAASGDRLAGPVSNEGGDVTVRGEFGLRGGGDADVTLLVTPRHADDAALARALAGIGTPEGSGWRLTWRGRAR